MKHTHLKLRILLLLFCCSFLLKAQITAPKRELRAVWIASVINIDYPPITTSSDFVLREEWLKILDKHKAMGINCLYVQVRPTSDALYKSSLVPWSRYLTGTSGQAPNNDFDPLPFMIQTAHERGMEFHAWMNPYRVSMDNQEGNLFAPNHVLNQHPEWCIKYGKRYILNPGLPEVRSHLNDVVTELITKYDIDGIHFDDYFYPYKNPGEAFPDDSTFQKYTYGFSNIEDWRRNNNDLLIQNLSKTIKRLKPRLQFGISPFGVWRNSNRDTEGSATQAGVTCYDDLYADVRKWLREGWIDYVVPQVYWQLGFSIADHATIVKWWSENSSGKPVYVGIGAYRIGQPTAREIAWSDPAEVGRQIQFSRTLKSVKGVAFFSSKSLTNNLLGISDTLAKNYFKYPALLPEVIKDTSLLECDAPELRNVVAENGKATIRWKPSRKTLKRIPFQYIVYRFENNNIDFTNGRNIMALIPFDTQDLTYIDKNVVDDEMYTYAVTVVDCQHHETPAHETISIGINTKTPTLPPAPTPQPPVVKKKKKSFWCRIFKCKN